MITYPARPAQGERFFKAEEIPLGRIYRPKVDGSRVLVDVWEMQAFNRHGDVYSKGAKLPWKSLEELSRLIGSCVGGANVCRWLDIEFFDKHEEMKGDVAFLDAPRRDCSFKGLLHAMAQSHIPVDSPLHYGSYGSVRTKTYPFWPPAFSRPEDGGPLLPEILPNIRWLPYWDAQHEDDRHILLTLWELLKRESKRLMTKDTESTPFYEGFVSVERDSDYPIQQRSAKEICPTWTKYRFSH